MSGGNGASVRPRLPLHALDGAGKSEQGPFCGFQRAAQEDQRTAGTGDFASTLDQFAFAGGIEEFAGERYRYAGTLEHRGGHREQTVIGKRHEAAAMNVARAVEMLLLDPEHTLHLAVFVDPVPERPVMGLEIVTPPGAPAGEFAFGFDVDAGGNGECRFGELVHGIWPSIAGLQPLNPIRARCANPDPEQCRRKALDRAEMRHKRPFRTLPMFLLRDP